MCKENNIYNFLLIVLCVLYIIIVLNMNINTYAENKEELILLSENVQSTVHIAESELIKYNSVNTSRRVSYYNINSHTDLSIMNTITIDQMNKIIDYWDQRNGGNSPFKGNGEIFINAAKETGLDPVYILAHAGLESAWGTSYYATTYHNYFGIGAFDSDPDNAINYSNNEMKQGIIEGAKWIKENYYNQGQTSLYSMRYNNGYHEYCTSTTWVESITDIIQTSYSLI